MTTNLHPCAAEACDKQIARHLFMCMPHWRMVPSALQRALRGAWRRYNEAGRAGCRTLADCEAVISTRRQAIDAVREKEIKRDLRNKQHGDVLNFE